MNPATMTNAGTTLSVYAGLLYPTPSLLRL